MNAVTKLALVVVAAGACGLALIVAGLWPHYRVASVIVGTVAAVSAPQLFAALWRDR